MRKFACFWSAPRERTFYRNCTTLIFVNLKSHECRFKTHILCAPKQQQLWLTTVQQQRQPSEKGLYYIIITINKPMIIDFNKIPIKCAQRRSSTGAIRSHFLFDITSNPCINILEQHQKCIVMETR